MKGIIVFLVGLAAFGCCRTCWAQVEDYGPLAASSTSVTSSGLNQYLVTMQAGRKALGDQAVDLVVFQWAMQKNGVPTDATPMTVNATRYNAALDPTNKNSLIRLIGDTITRKALKVRTLPDDPWALSAFVASASETMSATRAARLRDAVDAIRNLEAILNGED